ncbi:MAG: DUF192 domain-containing protein [Actinomycetota bacterium]|nr:DUF192 domain-containing protein [Actinomycetota bacterium]
MLDTRGRRWEVEVPQTARERIRGLLGRDSPPPGHAMLFVRTRSVHTVGMRFAIDVAFLDASLRVIAVRTMRPGRLSLWPRGTRHVLECAAGAGPREGDRLVPVEPDGT